MPSVSNKRVLKATYEAVVPLIRSNKIPTMLLYAEHTIFRSCWVGDLPKPERGQHVSKSKASIVIRPKDGDAKENGNRFSGRPMMSQNKTGSWVLPGFIVFCNNKQL